MPFSITGPRFAGCYKFTCNDPDFLNTQYHAAVKRKGNTFQQFEALMSARDTYGIANVTPELVKIDGKNGKEILGFSGEDAINFRTIKNIYGALVKAKMTGLVQAFFHRFSITPDQVQEIHIDERTFDSSLESGTDSDGLMIPPRKRDSKKIQPSRLSR